MPAVNHVRWCLQDERRLRKSTPDLLLAKRHLNKSLHNARVCRLLQEQNVLDWSLNVGFYAIYHCFLSLLCMHGYFSRNQSCTISVLLMLIEEGKIHVDKDVVLQFDTLDVAGDVLHSTVRSDRESATYGVHTSIDVGRLEQVLFLMRQVQDVTMRALG